jgi:hypothetical protein
MVLSPTFNNISAISWLSVLSVEESGVVLKTNEVTNNDLQNITYLLILFILSGT